MDSSDKDENEILWKTYQSQKAGGDCSRIDETTKLRQFAEENEIANNCCNLNVCLSGENGVLSRNKGSSVFIMVRMPRGQLDRLPPRERQ